MTVNTVTNPEESAKHYAGDDTHFAQKEEKKEDIDPYRRKFINVVVRQENELDDDLEEFYYELEPIIKNYDSGEAQSKVSPIIKNFFLVTFAGLILKHNISSARINGDWQIKQVNDKYNGEYDQEAKKAVQDTTSTIGNTLFYRKSPFSGITVGSQITTLQGSTLNSVRNIIRTGVEEGISADKLANNIKNYVLRPKDQSKWISPFDYFRQAFGTKRKPSNIYAGSVEYNCKRIARTEINNTWREATLRANRDQPWVKGYNWVLSPSHPTPDICDQWQAGSPYSYEEATKLGHPHCYDVETEVYTDEGWLYFKDLKKHNKILSLDPNTLDLEYLQPKEYISYKWADKMMSFTNRGFDLMVTPHHRMFVKKNSKSKSYELVRADSLTQGSAFYRSSEWKGKGSMTKEWLRFMGYYLADGSITKRGNSYQIIVSQSKEKSPKKYQIIEKDLSKLDYKINSFENGFRIYDKKLGEYLYQFGKASEKYVPEDIKELPKECLEEFLEAFRMCDVSEIKGKSYNNGNFKSELIYYTTSKRMADDIGEIILKCGFQPSFYVQKNKGRKVKFSNGEYELNHDVTIIRQKYRQKSYNDKNMKVEYIDYDDYVYDVELPKNHILWVRRNGKTVWSGNCMCRIEVEFKD